MPQWPRCKKSNTNPKTCVKRTGQNGKQISLIDKILHLKKFTSFFQFTNRRFEKQKTESIDIGFFILISGISLPLNLHLCIYNFTFPSKKEITINTNELFFYLKLYFFFHFSCTMQILKVYLQKKKKN